MKRTIMIIALCSFVSSGIFFCASMSPEKMACEQACKSAKDQCIEDAGDDDVKKAACEATCQQCVKECK